MPYHVIRIKILQPIILTEDRAMTIAIKRLTITTHVLFNCIICYLLSQIDKQCKSFIWHISKQCSYFFFLVFVLKHKCTTKTIRSNFLQIKNIMISTFTILHCYTIIVTFITFNISTIYWLILDTYTINLKLCKKCN